MTELHTPAEWLAEKQWRLLDHAGWEHPGPPLKPRSFDDPISYDEFLDRVWYSQRWLEGCGPPGAGPPRFPPRWKPPGQRKEKT